MMQLKLADSVLVIVVSCTVALFVTSRGEAQLKVEIVKNACPGEGCSFGKWRVIKTISVYRTPERRGSPQATLRPGDVVEALTGEVHMIPGLAKVIDEPSARGDVGIDPNKPLEILDYLGEGMSRTRQGTKYFSVKVARSKQDCASKPDWRLCWVELLREPTKGEWWVSISGGSGKLPGWIMPPDNSIRGQ